MSVRAITILSIAVLLFGCATAAQRQAQQIRTTNTAAAEQLKACAAGVYYSPENAPLRAHLSSNIFDATLQQMTDGSKATETEVQAIYVVHPQYVECRKTFLQNISPTTPTLVPIFADMYQTSEMVLIDVVQQKITWGDYVRRVKENAVATQARLTAAGQQIDAGLERSHQAELAQRQRAFEAMQQFNQNQQLINALNRPTPPTFTNCNAFGNSVNCITH